MKVRTITLLVLSATLVNTRRLLQQEDYQDDESDEDYETNSEENTENGEKVNMAKVYCFVCHFGINHENPTPTCVTSRT